MKESDLNAIIKKNINSQGQWAEKIADPAGIAARMASKNPFDGFGYTKEFNVVFESKLSKQYEAFNFGRIEDHQIENLKRIKEVCKDHKTKMLTIITFGVYIPRKGFDLFVFDINYILSLMNSGKKSLLKKELLEIKEKGNYIKIGTNKEFDYKLLLEKCIGV